MNYCIRSMFRLIGIIFMAVFITACSGGDPGSTKDSAEVVSFFPAPEAEWELVWSDEFDGDALDSTKWVYDLGDGSDVGQAGWGNREEQFYTEDNATVADGVLTIAAKNESVAAGYPYTSSRIKTLGKLDFTYGRVEASIKAPAGQGLWSAFWMLSSDSPYGSDGWAATGEIDIMEAASIGGDPNYFAGNVYHGFPWPLQQELSIAIDGDPSGDFNVYAIEWEGNEIRWFFNDLHYRTTTSDHYYSYYYDETDPGYKLAPTGAPFDTNFHLILNLAVGGDLPGAVDDIALPGGMEVEYVRVYKCAYDLADGSGCNSNNNRLMEVAIDKRPGTASYDLYVDAPAVLSWSILGEEYLRPLAIGAFDNGGALSVAEVVADDADRGMVIDVSTTGGGNINLYKTDDNPFTLFGMGSSSNPDRLAAGELRFDLYIDSANTAQDSNLLVKMDSGWPALGFVTLAVADLPQDQWTTVSVKVNDLLANSGEQALDTSNIVSLFVFEPTAAAHVQIDNISLSCGDPAACGITPPVPPAPPITGPFNMGGTWRMEPVAGAFGVGTSEGATNWFANTSDDVNLRGCYFNDDYVFTNDGAFNNVLGDDTWIEQWQGGLEFGGCNTPVSPHDGTTDYTYVYDEAAGTLTITGLGAYIGLAKVVNGEELTDPNNAPESVTYNVEEIGNDKMRLTVAVADPGWWVFNLVKVLDAPQPPAPTGFAGTWQLANEEASFGVGPTQGDTSWFAIDAAGLTQRACFMDDDYVFGNDGSFNNVLGADTWLETWQGVAAEECGAPVAPNDGMGDYTYTYDETAGTLTVTGIGAYVGLPKAVNAGELPAVGVPESITYLVNFVDSNTMIVDIEAGPGVWWRYKLVKNGGSGGGGGDSTSGGNLIIDATLGIDFEGLEEDQASWNVFENGTNPALEFVTNPDMVGNTSMGVAKITLEAAGAGTGMFAGANTRTVSTFQLTTDTVIAKIWVWKDKISPVGIKFERDRGDGYGSHGELTVSNTLTNQWEQLTIDFTAQLGLPENDAISGIVIFPDMVDGRDATVVYFDEITFTSN